MNRRRSPSKLLRWYPRAWRERYGDEFAALLEDSAADGRLTFASRVSIVGSGLRERARGAGLTGDTASPVERVRAGALLVLSAWAVFVVAGASFSKMSEQFDVQVPAASRALPWDAFAIVQKVAVLAALLVGVGAAVAVPALMKLLRDGGWPSISRHIFRATAVTAVAVVATAGLVPWAHSLSFAQRNGNDWPYTIAFLMWALLIVALLGLWTAAAVAIGRRLEFAPAILATEALLAGALTTAMIAMTAATATWWAAIATDAPWFLHGTAPGTSGSPFEPRLAIAIAAMTGATALATFGTVRAACSWKLLRTG